MANFIDSATAGAGLGATIGSVVPGIGNVAGTVGGAILGGVSSLFNPNSESATGPSSLLSDNYINLGRLGNKKETRAMDANARLAALQQYYAQQNNAQDLQNTYKLTADTAQLESQGKRNAGISLAGDGSLSSASSAPAISSPSLPSAPAVDDSPSSMDSLNFIRDVSSLLSNIKLNDSAARKNNAEADTSDIENLSKYDRDIADLDSKLQNNKISRVEYKRLKTSLEFERSTVSTRIEREKLVTANQDLQNQIVDLQKQNQEVQNQIVVISRELNSEQLKQAKFITEHQVERYVTELNELRSRIRANDASASASFASAALSNKQTQIAELTRKLEAAKVPYASQFAKAAFDSAFYNSRLADYNQQKAYYDSKIASYGSVEASKRDTYRGTLGDAPRVIEYTLDMINPFKSLFK